MKKSWRVNMTQLTVSIIRKIIKGNPKVDRAIDLDEQGRAILYTTDGWTWQALDGNRTVEGFNLRGNHWEQPDTVDYLKWQIQNIERIMED